MSLHIVFYRSARVFGLRLVQFLLFFYLSSTISIILSMYVNREDIDFLVCMLVCIIDCIYTFGYLIICSLRLFIFHINQNNANAICKILKTNEYETNPRQYPAKCTTNQTKPTNPQTNTHFLHTITTNTTTTTTQYYARLCWQSVPMVYKSTTSHSSYKSRRYLQMADNQNEDEQAQLLGEEGVRASQPGQNLKLG